MLVASRYRDRPGRGLIGPQLFPFYWFTLRALFGLWLTIRVIIDGVRASGNRDPPRSILMYLAATSVTRDSLLAASRHHDVRRLGIPGVQISDIQKDGSRSLCLLSRRRSGSRILRVRRFKLPAASCGFVFCGMALFLPAMSWVWGGQRRFRPVCGRLRDARCHCSCWHCSGLRNSWLNYTRFAAAEWRPVLRIRRESCCRIRGWPSSSLRARRFPGGGSELESRASQAADDS